MKFSALCLNTVNKCFADKKYLPDKGKVMSQIFFTNAGDVFEQHKQAFPQLPEAQAIVVSNPKKLSKCQLVEVAEAELGGEDVNFGIFSSGELCDMIADHSWSGDNTQGWHNTYNVCGCESRQPTCD